MQCGWPPLAHLKLIKIYTCQEQELSHGSSASTQHIYTCQGQGLSHGSSAIHTT